MENKFEIGDRVRIKLRGYSRHKEDDGITRTILSIITDSDLDNVMYSIDDSHYDEFYEDELEHSRVRNTKLARKMYPQGEEKGEWLYV